MYVAAISQRNLVESVVCCKGSGSIAVIFQDISRSISLEKKYHHIQ